MGLTFIEGNFTVDQLNYILTTIPVHIENHLGLSAELLISD